MSHDMDDEELTEKESTQDKDNEDDEDDEDEDDEDYEDDEDDALTSKWYSQEGDDSELSDANNNITDQDNDDSDEDWNGFSSPLKTVNRIKTSKKGCSVCPNTTRAKKKKEENPTRPRPLPMTQKTTTWWQESVPVQQQ